MLVNLLIFLEAVSWSPYRTLPLQRFLYETRFSCYSCGLQYELNHQHCNLSFQQSGLFSEHKSNFWCPLMVLVTFYNNYYNCDYGEDTPEWRCLCSCPATDMWGGAFHCCHKRGQVKNQSKSSKVISSDLSSCQVIWVHLAEKSLQASQRHCNRKELPHYLLYFFSAACLKTHFLE